MTKQRRKSSSLRYILIAIFLVVAICMTAFVLHLVMPRSFDATGSDVTLHLKSGDFICPYFPAKVPKGAKVKGLVVLATGDGGWSYWEDNTAHSLADHGYAVMGWDCRKFADSRTYDHEQLGEGFHAAVEAGISLAGHSDAPIWYGGWSTGAEQSVAAAASSKRPKRLVGLLLAAPGERGRFGIATGDLLGITPEGDGTFALSDMAQQMENIRIAQFVAGFDPMDDTSWLDSLAVPHKVYDLPDCLHDMGGAGQEFQSKLLEAVEWTSQNETPGSQSDSVSSSHQLQQSSLN